MARGYESFIGVRFRHDYYRDGSCPDLRAVPTAETAALLGARQLRFVPRSEGFTLLGPVETDSAGNVQARFPLEEGARLVFALVLTRPDLLYVTDLPLEQGSRQRYLLRNRQGATTLTSGTSVEAADQARLSSPQLTVAVPRSAIGGFVQVEDEAGAELARARVPSFDGDTLNVPLDLGDFGGLARLQVGASTPEPLFVDAELPALGPFAVLELCPLTEPWPPRRVADGKQTLAPIEFTAGFHRRSTHWRYHVVVPMDFADTLTIRYPQDAPAPYPSGITFARATFPEVVARFPGRSVVSFKASAALPFHESPLRNMALESTSRGTLLPHLPNAPRNTLKRADTAPEQLVSDICIPL
ncbi:hypothetical protein [Corallococcus aberystwythensis]|uniref:Uncharacterized protein n=1 Tax=Corallococcus aberystwythensis TaxID=2316722 RepID=A0A3A8Q8F1_9BACT|nr:hypothetical protein [Corallococcus aberystwythensis]RKH59554.1 hypothetical protein D7W81_27090 [Corallococcus aberystwythensis]